MMSKNLDVYAPTSVVRVRDSALNVLVSRPGYRIAPEEYEVTVL